MAFENAPLLGGPRTPDIIARDDVRNKLEAVAPRKGRIVELRFNGGLNIEETGWEISHARVERECRVTRASLYRGRGMREGGAQA